MRNQNVDAFIYFRTTVVIAISNATQGPQSFFVCCCYEHLYYIPHPPFFLEDSEDDESGFSVVSIVDVICSADKLSAFAYSACSSGARHAEIYRQAAGS